MPLHRARGAASPYAIAPDTHGLLRFGEPTVGGDAVIVLLGSGVGNDHLADFVANGVSHIVADTETPDLAAMLTTLERDFAVGRIALESGGGLNGAMVEAGLVNELQVLVVPAIDGADRRPGIVTAARAASGARRGCCWSSGAATITAQCCCAMPSVADGAHALRGAQGAGRAVTPPARSPETCHPSVFGQ